MLEYDRIDISEGIDINKSNDKSKECGICHYWYFLDKNFSYQKITARLKNSSIKIIDIFFLIYKWNQKS